MFTLSVMLLVLIGDALTRSWEGAFGIIWQSQ